MIQGISSRLHLPKSHLVSACIINLVLYTVFLLLFTPLINNQEDAFALYILGGGFGNPPSNLLHYDHIYHPWLTYLIKELFIAFPSFNWLTITLLLFEFSGFTALLVSILKKENNWWGLLIYALLFFVFGSQYLLSIGINNTATVLTIAALSLLISKNSYASKPIRIYICAFIFLILAALLRIHIVIFIVTFTLPLFISFQKKKLNLLYLFLITTITILFLNQQHKAYYSKADPEWPKEEERRQSIYKFYNQPSLTDTTASPMQTELLMVNKWLVWDTGFLSDNKLKKIKDERQHYIKIHSNSSHTLENEWLKWQLINNKVYFITFLCLLIFYATKKLLYPLVITITGISFITIFLVLHFKIPAYYFITVFFCLSVFTYLLSDKTQKYLYIKTATFVLLSIWGCIIAWKKNSRNIHLNTVFKQTVAETSAAGNTIFLDTDNSFPIDYFRALDLPADYPVINVILFDHQHTFLYTEIFKRYNVSNFRELFQNKNLLLLGQPPSTLPDYLLMNYGINMTISEPLTSFRNIEVRKFIIQQPLPAKEKDQR